MQLKLDPNANLKPTMPPCAVEGYVGSVILLDLLKIPAEIGNVTVTGVRVAATYPDNSTATVDCSKETDGTWSCTLPATPTSGRVANGVQFLIDGTTPRGDIVTGYVLAITELAVYTRDMTVDSGGTSWIFHFFDTPPAPPKKGDVALVSNVLKYYNGSAWTPFADLSDYYTAEQVDERLAGKASTADATLAPVYAATTSSSSWSVTSDTPFPGPLVLRYDDGAWEPGYYDPGTTEWTRQGAPKGTSTSASISWSAEAGEAGANITATRTDAPVSYQLGTQSDRKLATAEQGAKAETAVQPSALNAKLDSTSAAPAFSSDSTAQYAVGAHCTYNGKLYKCTTATTGGTWDASKWTEDNMAAILGNIESALDIINNGAQS